MIVVLIIVRFIRGFSGAPGSKPTGTSLEGVTPSGNIMKKTTVQMTEKVTRQLIGERLNNMNFH